VGPYLEVLRMIRRLFRILGKTEVLKGFLVDLKWKGMECSSSFGYYYYAAVQLTFNLELVRTRGIRLFN